MANTDQSPMKHSTYLMEPFGKFVMDVDIGGTFTDAVISRKNSIEFLKVETTPHDLSLCLREILARAVESMGMEGPGYLLRETRVIRVSTSLSTNILVEGKGGDCGLLITDQALKQIRPDEILFEGSGRPLVNPDMIARISEVNGRDEFEDGVRERVHELLERGCRIIVVSLPGQEALSVREQRVKDAIEKFYPKYFIGSVPVLLSNQVSVVADYSLRTSTALMNAYCLLPLSADFYQMEAYLRKSGYRGPLLIVHSSGGGSRVAKTRPVQTINSGSSAGVFGLLRLVNKEEFPNMISVDIGGTSTEIGLIHQKSIAYSQNPKVDGIPVDLRLPVLNSIGVGGGSILSLGKDGSVDLGPDSAGSFPGPACYGMGGSLPTLTDAFLVMGYLDERSYLGGRKTVWKYLAEKAILERLCTPLGVSSEEVAFLAVKMAVDLVAKAIVRESASSGVQISRMGLAAVGGAGGCLGPLIMQQLEMRSVHVFRQGAVFGAFGASGMDVLHVFERRLEVPFERSRTDCERVCSILNEKVTRLQREAFRDMSAENFRPEEIRFELEIELLDPFSTRSIHITFEDPFLWPQRDWTRIAKAVRAPVSRRGKAESGIVLSRLYLKAAARVPHAEMSDKKPMENDFPKHISSRPVYCGAGRWCDAPVFMWDELPFPTSFPGPALLECPDTTVFLPEGFHIEIDRNMAGVIRPWGAS